MSDMNEVLACPPETISGSPRLRAADGLKALIRQQGWPVGRRLPSEEAIAAQFGVSRSTLRKALDALESEGWVHRERNRGCVVAREPILADPLTSRTILVVNDSPENAKLGTRDDSAAAGVQHGMVEAAGARKYGLLFVALDAIDATMQCRLMEDVPAGVALLSWRPRSVRAAKLAELFSKRNVPLAAFGIDECPEAVACYDRVVSDHESGMAQLLVHLANAGRRRILRLWTPSPETPWIVAHERAFARLAGPLGLESIPPVHIASLPARLADDCGVFEQRARVMAGYIAENIRGGRTPDAIMVGTDCETFPVAAACRMLGLVPGEDVLITGYDNYWHVAFERRFELSLPFASVDKRNAEIGAEMIRLLSDRNANGAPASPRLSKIEQVAVEVNYRQNVARGLRA